MRAIIMVLTSLAICVAFVIFFALFAQIPLLMLGIFLVVAMNMTRRRRPQPSGPVIDATEFEVDA